MKNKVFNEIKKYPKKVVLTILCFAMAIVMIYSFKFYSGSERLGMTLGEGIGSSTGRIVGSLEGVTKGRTEGTDAGKQEGISAKDTKSKIANEMKESSDLEVLVASIKLNDMHEVGADYAALYTMKGTVIFTVDMSQAKITEENGQINIYIPKPKGKVHIDEDRIKKVAEYQKYWFTGSAEIGFDAFLNTMRKVNESSAEALYNYAVLLQQAENSAEDHIKALCKAVSVNPNEVNITFNEE